MLCSTCYLLLTTSAVLNGANHPDDATMYKSSDICLRRLSADYLVQTLNDKAKFFG